MANHQRDKNQDVEVVDKPQEIVAVTNEAIHPCTGGGELGHWLLIPKPPLEEPDGMFLIVPALGR
jgi:hypothetical protein